jgi:hypothetical protein
MINTKLQNIIDTKSAIGNAIVNKGGTITSETPFFNYAAQIDSISTGTPQTIFQASDGSKWALTNAVNLVNDAGNVTSDFNYWQPANNSTSDPILNIGTVGANISGNIQLVQVNEVNIAQFENIVATDIDGAKYEGYNGYDSQTNPTPTGNVVFNRWLLNNSASGTVLFANTVITNGGTFNGANLIFNESNMGIVSNVNYGVTSRTITANNGFIYVGGNPLTGTNRGITKIFESNFALVGANLNSSSTANYGGTIYSVKTNNGFLYVAGSALTGTNRGVGKYYESNLALVGNTVNYSDFALISNIAINNGFIYVIGQFDQNIKKYDESNLAFIANGPDYGGFPTSVAINNGFIYVGGATNNTVKKFYESNLAFIGNTAVYGGAIETVLVNNGFIYAGGTTNQRIQKFFESNLARASGTNVSNDYGGFIASMYIDNGFIYVGGRDNRTVQKFYEDNLAFLANTANYGGDIETVFINGPSIYVAGFTNFARKYDKRSITTFNNQTFYTATKIKE